MAEQESRHEREEWLRRALASIKRQGRSRRASLRAYIRSGRFPYAKWGDEQLERMLRSKWGTVQFLPPVPPSSSSLPPDKDATKSWDVFLAVGAWLHPVSTDVEAWIYNPAQQVLVVEFKSEYRVYEYRPVEIALAEEFFNAPSPGKFVWTRLRNIITAREIMSYRRPRNRRSPTTSRSLTHKPL